MSEDHFTLQEMLEGSPAGHAIVGMDGELQYANSSFCSIFGVERSSVLGQHLLDLFLQTDQAQAKTCFSAASEQNSAQVAEVRAVNDVHGTVYLKLTVAPLRRPGGNPQYQVHVEDLTREHRRQKVQQIIRRLGHQIVACATPQEVATQVLEAADELFQWDSCFINLYSPVSGAFELLLSIDEVNGERVQVPSAFDSPPPGSNTDRALKEGAFLLLREPGGVEDLNSTPYGNNRASASLMFVPMRREGRNVGTLSIQSYRYHAYTDEDLALLQELADFSSTAFELTFAQQKAVATEAELLEKQKRFDLFMLATNDFMYDYDLEGGSLWWNPGALAAFNVKAEDANGDWWISRIHPEDRDGVLQSLNQAVEQQEKCWAAEYRFLLADGSYANFYDRAYILYENGKAVRLFGSFMNITERKRAEELLRHGAYHDPLTNLPNRAHIIEELTRSLARTSRHEDLRTGLMFLDLDRFKGVNDRLGHSSGDQLLIKVADTLRECVRPSDLVGRLGGDEFTILLEDIASEHDAMQVAERILQCLLSPFIIEGNEVYTGASIGITLSSPRYTSAEEMLRDADIAMYRAKVAGKGRFEIFDQEMHAKVLAAIQLEYDLRRALQQEQFVLHYQGIFDVATREVVAYEALVRWNHPGRGLLAPGVFIGPAEETGLIVPIGEWVLRTACREASTWTRANGRAGRSPTLHVNVSARQFSTPGFTDTVAAILAESGLDAGHLTLEITESLLLEGSAERKAEFDKLRAMGVQFSLDDFGTGYSSLSYLHQYPIDGLKIDRSFVSRFHSDPANREIVKAIISIANAFQLSVVGEGIETEEEIEVLRQLGCSAGQGYLLHRPAPANLLPLSP